MTKQPPQKAIDAAVAEAKASTCSKSNRGVVAVSCNTGNIVGYGYNEPPVPYKCLRNDECKANCNKYCIHAEIRAMNMVVWMREFVDLVHVKVVDGELVKGGPPSCWQCSREILERNFRGVWLYLDPEGWTYYTALEFHAVTLKHCGISQAVDDTELKMCLDDCVGDTSDG